MADDFTSVSTQLLTLLNVSATKRPKRKRLDVAEEPQKKSKLNGQRKAPFADSTDGSSNVVSPSKGKKPDDPKRRIKHIDIDVDVDADTAGAATVEDAFNSHFGAISSALTTASSDAVDAGDWINRPRKIGSLGQTVESLPKGVDSLADERPRARMDERLMEVFKPRLDAMSSDLRLICDDFLGVIGTYQDVYVSHREVSKQQTLREAVTAHALNHVLKIRRRVLKNNERLAHLGQADIAEAPPDIQDQGFTRPKMLLLLPLRNSALAWTRTLIENSPTSQCENQARFLTEFSLPDGVTDRLAENPENYPADHVETFSGNIDDNFRFGLKLTRKALKLFTEFYSSDVIVASPLGLKVVIEKDKSKSADFLSSIEILVVDQLDVMSMQNWEHVKFILDHINKLPTETRDSDFSRIKSWYLDGQAAKLRQTIMFSSYETPEMRSLFNRTLLNVAGKLRTEERFQGVLSTLPNGIQQTFVRFSCASLIAEPDSRLDYFMQQMLPSLLKSAVKSVNTLIFVPSYFDFIALCDRLHSTEDVSYACLSEDSSNQDISRARQAFFLGQKAFLIMTERFHFYRRYRIRGVKNVIFYGLPEHGNYYDELLSFPFLEDEAVDASDVTSQALFSQYDLMRLERIVGTADARKMVKSKEDTFTFV